MTSACPNCKTRLEIEHSFCPNCGFDLRGRHTQKVEPTGHSENHSSTSLVLTTGLRLIKVLGILTCLTVVYSLLEGRPPKIIVYFISTFTISLFGSLLILLIAAITKKERNSFIGQPYKVILTLIIIIGLGKIIGAYSAQQKEASVLNNKVETLGGINTEPQSDQFLRDFYDKYAPRAYTAEKAKLIKDLYGTDYNGLINDLYQKFEIPLTPEKCWKIQELYGLISVQPHSMNEELLIKLYQKYGLSPEITFEQFSQDMRSPDVQRKFFDEYALSQKGTFRKFQTDLLTPSSQDFEELDLPELEDPELPEFEEVELPEFEP